MLLTNRAINRDICFDLSGVALVRLSEVRDLGVLFNSKLNFVNHIDVLIGKAKQRLFLLRKSFSHCNGQALVLAFKTYIVPLLEYCSPVWSPSSICDIVRIESVQRSFTKSLNFCYLLPYNERLHRCNLLSLERRRLIADLVLLFKMVNKLIEIDLDCSITPIVDYVTRGHSRRLRVPLARLNTRLNFFTVKTVKVWNCLSEQTVIASSAPAFKNHLNFENLSKYLMLGF